MGLNNDVTSFKDPVSIHGAVEESTEGGIVVLALGNAYEAT